jgi:hypothetical protein
MAGIFISYRREDAAAYAGRIADALAPYFRTNQIFLDVETIPPGVDFPTFLRRRLENSNALLVLIGKRWLDCVDERGERRLDQPDDFVRLEIATALQQGVRTIPLLLDGARMPQASELPPDLAQLPRQNAIEITHGRFHRDIAVLAESLGGKRPARGPGRLVRMIAVSILIFAVTIFSVQLDWLPAGLMTVLPWVLITLYIAGEFLLARRGASGGGRR